jgi:RNA 2',3'-cyclic 3'-phosphodiesterase
MPEPQRQELGRFIAECASRAPDFRWTPVENLHLTVRFVGSVNRRVVESVAEALTGRALTSFDMALAGVGTFGRGRAVRVVWLGLREGAEAAAAIAAEVDAECVRVGLVGEDRPYQAHLTLARARPRGGARLPDLPAVPELPPWRARELVLYSSRLTKSGAVYEAIRTLVLA